MKHKVLPIVLACLAGVVLVAAVLAEKLAIPWLAVVLAGSFLLRRKSGEGSLFADALLTIFGLALTCLPIFGLGYLAQQEQGRSCPRYDLSRLEQVSRPVLFRGKFQLCGNVYFSAAERSYTRDYGWVQPVYSRRHPRFPGNLGPDAPPSYFLLLDQDHLDRLAHRYLPPRPQQGIRDQIFVSQTRTGFLREEPGELLVLPVLTRARSLSLLGLVVFASGLSMLLDNLGRQFRARHRIERWNRNFGD